MVDNRQENKRRSVTSPAANAPSKKKKLAPRSSLQFKVGPQFTPTVVTSKIVNSSGLEITPLLTPRIDRGFDRIDGEWVGYKRNYFTLVGTFQFPGVPFDEFARDQYYVIDPSTDSRVKIRYFGLRLVSRSAEDGCTVNLVQHTAKRDRGPQFTPQIQPAVPSELPNHDIIREAANIRNSSKIAKLNSIFVYQRDPDDKDNSRANAENLQRYPHDRIAKVARYERIQFSSSINYKKPPSNNKRFKLCMELVGFSSKNDFVTLAYSETPPLIVRGRSPSNYAESEEKTYDKSIDDIKQDQTPASLPLQHPSPPTEKLSVLVFEKNISPSDLEDIETYDILKAATDALDGLSPNGSLKQSKLKSKKGRKNKNQNNPPRVTKRKSTKLLKRKPSTKMEKSSVLQNVSTNIPSFPDVKMGNEVIKLENFLNLDFDENLLGSIEIHEFGESFINFEHSEKISSKRLFQPESNSPTQTDDYKSFFDDYDLEIEMMKERADSIKKAKTQVSEAFIHINEMPSFGLEFDGFDDGNDFIIDN